MGEGRRSIRGGGGREGTASWAMGTANRRGETRRDGSVRRRSRGEGGGGWSGSADGQRAAQTLTGSKITVCITKLILKNIELAQVCAANFSTLVI